MKHKVTINASVIVEGATHSKEALDLLLQAFSEDKDLDWEGYGSALVEASPWWNEDEPCQIPLCNRHSAGPHLGLCEKHLVCPNCGNPCVDTTEGIPPELGGIDLDLYELENGEVFTEVFCNRCEHTYDTRFDSTLVQQVAQFLGKVLPSPQWALGTATTSAQVGETVLVSTFEEQVSCVAAAPITAGERVIRLSFVDNKVVPVTKDDDLHEDSSAVQPGTDL